MKVLQLELVAGCLSEHQRKHLRNLALQGMPNEVCGVVYEHDIIVQYQNCSSNPEHSFDAEIDIGDVGVKAIWHSHPSGMDGPSADDLKFIEWCVAHDHNFHHIIVTSNTVNEFKAKLVDKATTV